MALANVDRLLNAASPEAIDQAYSPDFRQQIPTQKLVELFASVHRDAGACSRKGVEERSETSATALYGCEHGQARVALRTASPTDPRMIEFTIRPVQ
jgi:hypothetical protein